MGLTPIREYPTFQAAYELHPQNRLSVDGLYVKTVLLAVEWLRGRVAKKGGDPSFLGVYPAPDAYETYKQEDFKDLSAVTGYDIKVVSWDTHSTWVLRVIELSDKTDNQSFNTEVTVRKSGVSVLLAARIICREPVTEERRKAADVYRLGLISHMLLLDPDITMTEYGVSMDYPLVRDLISLNGKSRSDCEVLDNGLLSNEDRQYPVLILTREMADRLGESDAMDKLLQNGKCLSYMVAVENSPQKLVRNQLGQDRLADDMAAGRKVAAVTDAGSGCRVKTFEIFDEEGNLRLPYFNEMCAYLQSNTRNREFDYHDIGFFSAVRQKKLLETLPRTEDPAKNAEIAAVIQGLEDELNEKADNEKLLGERIAELEKENDKLIDRNRNLSRENLKLEKLELELEDIKQSVKSGDAETARLAERLAEAHADKLEFIERTKALLDVPVKCTREELVTWIRDNYGDRLVLHERGVKTFLDDNKPRDLNYFCRIIHFLYGFTKCLAEDGCDIDAANESARDYDLLSEGLEVTYVGSWSLEHYPEDYTINISAIDPNETDVLMKYHISIGKGMDRDSVRIYLYWDSNIGKSIIGAMYVHLEIGMK